MTSSAPWWGTSLFTLATALVTGFIAAFTALAPKRTERRLERRRLSRDHKERSYPEITRVTYKIAAAPVWSTGPNQDELLLDELITAAHQAAFFAPTTVITAIHELLATATSLNDTRNHIRSVSEPGHSGRIDVAHADKHTLAINRLLHALQNFINTSRGDLEIPGAYPTLAKPDSASTREPS
ncbi:hypothetical protein AB0878_47890 [Amycolatopsis sp. NPDC047767]|uniref:hypothetical protein n=1 Tax=Amycolatopsis sp. NPDC047767 TaxID=3156765 RepID=UPI0034564F57